MLLYQTSHLIYTAGSRSKGLQRDGMEVAARFTGVEGDGGAGVGWRSEMTFPWFSGRVEGLPVCGASRRRGWWLRRWAARLGAARRSGRSASGVGELRRACPERFGRGGEARMGRGGAHGQGGRNGGGLGARRSPHLAGINEIVRGCEELRRANSSA